MREIKEGPDFRQCVERLGGYRAIDRAMETIIEGLMRRPEGFPSHQSALCKVRYAKTKPIGDEIPPLVVIFEIDENDDVILQ